MTLTHSLIYTAPAGEKTDMNKRQRVWNDFLNSLDIDYIKNKKKQGEKKQTINDVTTMVKGLDMKIPIFTPKRKKDDK